VWSLATEVAGSGVISPGGVGFDVSCGVPVLATSLGMDEVWPRLDRLMTQLKRRVLGGPVIIAVSMADQPGAGYRRPSRQQNSE